MEKVACTHCALEFDASQMIIEEDAHAKRFFCCKGCQGVYHLLHQEGLESFYDKRSQSPLHSVSNFLDKNDTHRFDLEGFQKRYVKEDENGLFHISLIIEGIHCSACVWLNEKVLHKLEGVVEAHINFSTHKAKIVWDPDLLPLSRIIETIRSIGYNAYPYDPSLQEERSAKMRKDYYTRILVAIFGAMNIMWLAVAHYAGYFSGIKQSYKDVLNFAQFLLATPVLFYSGWVFFKGAYYGYKNRTVNMDTLVASGALSAYVYSVYAMVTHSGEVYFDSVVMIITFILVGKYLEVLSKKQAVDTLDSLIGSTPTEVMLVRKDGTKALVSIENVQEGDVIEIKSGEKVVIDGTIVNGEGSFDESSITGESQPVTKALGDTIISGSICLDSTIRYQATTTAQNSLLTTIISLLEEAVTKKPPVEQLANQISGYFSTVVLAISLVTFGGWYLYQGEIEEALIIAISVIVIACPCALGLATPMATLMGISVSAKKGIIFKEARHLETMATCTVLALDKTGTLTEGKPALVASKIFEKYDSSLLYALVSESNHPVSKSLCASLQRPSTIPPLKNLKVLQAKGIYALTTQGDELIGGNVAFLRENGIELNMQTSRTSFVFAINKKPVALFEFEDKLKEGARKAIEQIKKMGIEPVLLTGDSEVVAKHIASQAGIKTVHAKLLPTDKADIIRSYQQKGKRVIMAGDGINDALVLAQSDIAIAMGSGADIAVEVSDVIVLDDSPIQIAHALSISKKTYRTIKENLAFSLLYNLITIPVASAGLVNPLVAALSMSLSSLIVVANSFRIKYTFLRR